MLKPWLHLPVAFIAYRLSSCFSLMGRVSRPMRQQINRQRSDVDSGHNISVSLIPALDTPEVALCGSIGSGAMSAFWTGPRSALRVDKDHRNPHFLGFVFDLIDKVTKSPRVDHPSESPRTLGAISNAVQALKGNDWIGVLASKFNQLLTDNMVYILLPATFFAFGDFNSVNASMSLKSATDVKEVFSPIPQRQSVPDLYLVGRFCRSQADYPQVHSDDCLLASTAGRSSWSTQGQANEPCFSSLKEFRVAFNVLKPISPLLGDRKRKPFVDPSLASGYSDDRPFENIRRDTETYDGGIKHFWLANFTFGFSQPEVGLRMLDRIIDRHPCVVPRKSQFSGFVVGCFVDFTSAACFVFKREVQTNLRCLGENNGHSLKPLSFGGCRVLQFDYDYFFHVYKYIT